MSNPSDFVIESGVLKRYTGPGGDVTIPESVTSIQWSVFKGCKTLTSLTVPDSVTQIGSEAFANCDCLESITICGALKSIGWGAFTNCNELTAVYLLNVVRSFGTGVFQSCGKINCFYAPLLSPADLEACGQNIVATRTFVRKFRDYSNPIIVDEYVKYLASKKKILLPDLFLADAVEVLKMLASAKKITKKNFDREFLQPALEYKAASCVNYLETLYQDLKESKNVKKAPNLLESDASIMEKLALAKQKERRPAETLVYSQMAQAEIGTSAIEKLLRSQLGLNITVLALKLCEKAGKLSEYALLRGLKTDDVRDSLVLPGLGLDDEGKKTYDLGGKTVHIQLEQNLCFSIYDDNTGKTIKSIPKSKADPAKVKEAQADLSYLKTTVKELVKRKTRILFQAFLKGTSIPFDEWKRLYLGSEVMRSLSRLIIWQQGDATFTISGRKAVYANGQPYLLIDAPVYVSYPTEMKQEDIDAWQKYFARTDLKQPFLQIWEPVIAPSSISQDRYRNIMIPFYHFKDQDRHGIHVEDIDYHKYVTIKFDDCKTEVNRIDNWRHQLRIEDRFEVWGFGFEKYTRQVNHIVSLLDKWTVEDRVRKDDVSVMDLMDAFTLAQVTDFISLAQEAQAVNVLALLLDYKNAHFADFDPMDEFTLES